MAADHVVIAGHSCVDLVPVLLAEPSVTPGVLSDLGPLELRCGGSVVNTGEVLAALGVPVRVAATVGADVLGAILETRLRELDPEARIALSATGTSYSIVLEHDGGSRTIWHHGGSNAAFTGAEVDPVGAALVHVGYATALPALLDDGLAPFVTLLDRISAAGATSSVDLATLDAHSPEAAEWPRLLSRLLPRIDVLSPSADDLVSIGWLPANPTPGLIADAARRLVDGGVGLAYVTDGARGAHLVTAPGARFARGGRVLRRLAPEWFEVDTAVPGVHVERIVGTNGAGDTATAALIHALLNGYTPRDAGRAATALAAERIGGRDFGVTVAI